MRGLHVLWLRAKKEMEPGSLTNTKNEYVTLSDDDTSHFRLKFMSVQLFTHQRDGRTN